MMGRMWDTPFAMLVAKGVCYLENGNYGPEGVGGAGKNAVSSENGSDQHYRL